MENRKHFLENVVCTLLRKESLKTAAPMLCYTAVAQRVFSFLEQRNISDYFYPEIQVDYLIPFLPGFILPYVAWFIWIPFVMVILLATEKKAYKNTAWLLAAGYTIFLVFSYLIPTKLTLRPVVLPADGLLLRAIKWLYHMDTPTNVFPSIHVFNTIVALNAVMHGNNELFRNRKFRVFSILLSAAICMSTVVLKQHSVSDIFGAFVMYAVLYGLLKLNKNNCTALTRIIR